MTDRRAAVRLWTNALQTPSEGAKSSLEAVLADGVTMSSPMGTTDGKEAVLAGFGTSPLAPLLAQASWSEPSGDGDTVVTSARFGPGTPVGGLTVSLTFDAADLIVKAETSLIAAPPPVATEVQISEAMKTAIDGALASANPILMAYVDPLGRPHMAFRGSTQVYSPDQLAVWVRNPEGGLLAAIGSNPHVSFLYRDAATRTFYTVYGRARAYDTPEVRDRVYQGSPEVERNFDPQRRGAPVIIEIDRIEGRDANGPVLMERGVAAKED
jgi:hypothetical protein